MAGPTTATIKRLFAVSGNQCAFPGCTLPLVDPGSGKVTAYICHIKARSLKGPRYDPAQPDEARHGFNNLVLMCPIHHDVIDDDPNTCTVEELLRIKVEHEAANAGGPEPTDDVARQFAAQVRTEGDVSGQVGVGEKVIQFGDVSDSQITIADTVVQEAPKPPLPPSTPPCPRLPASRSPSQPSSPPPAPARNGAAARTALTPPTPRRPCAPSSTAGVRFTHNLAG